jgi:hypothetical protein
MQKRGYALAEICTSGGNETHNFRDGKKLVRARAYPCSTRNLWRSFMTPLGRSGLIKRLTGVNLEATRQFLLQDCFVPGKGFSSQYAGQETVSCATSAICTYALSETGKLSRRQKREFQRVLLGFRATVPTEQAGAFPRTTGGEPSTWTTGQAALALLSLRASWNLIEPSVKWLLARQATNGGWNFGGTQDGHERLIYAFYPTLVLLRCRARLGQAGKRALSRVSAFIESCQELENPFWIPLRNHLRASLERRRGHQSADDASLDDYWQLFEQGWPPPEHIDEDWLSKRFSMALMCGSNYLLLRRQIAANHPLALLHLRYLADERIGNGWNDKREEQQPKTWATALGALTLHRWARDLSRISTRLTRIPTRSELVLRLRAEAAPERPISSDAGLLLRRFSQLHPGPQHAAGYQALVRDVFTFLFGSILKDPKSESRTIFGTLRRDLTFRNAAETGPWCDWKREHHIHSVLIECKNSKEALSYDDLRETACYLGKRMGYLGILACRNTTADDVREILNWFVTNDEKYVLVVNDDTLIDWIRLKDRGGDPTDAIADLHRSLREGAQ